jgi:hypothetical protein
MLFSKFDKKFLDAAKNSNQRREAIKSYSFVRAVTFIVGILSLLMGIMPYEESIASLIPGLLFLMISFSFDSQVKILKLKDEDISSEGGLMDRRGK